MFFYFIDSFNRFSHTDTNFFLQNFVRILKFTQGRIYLFTQMKTNYFLGNCVQVSPKDEIL